MQEEPMVGLHVSVAGSLDLAFDRAQELGATTFQMFTRNPNQWKFKPIPDDVVTAFREKRAKTRFRRIVDHMPYLPNLASPEKSTMKMSRYTLDEEVKRCDALGVDYLVVHLGSHLGKGSAVGIANVAGACNEAISGGEGQTTVLLENMAGQKNSVGARFEEIRAILDEVKGERVGVCFDSCLPPGSLILANGVPTNVENVSVGDAVLDSAGSITIVTRAVQRPYVGDLVMMKPAGLPWLTVTPEHPILCVSVNRIRYLEQSPWSVKMTNPPVWVAAGDWRVGNYVLMPKPVSNGRTRIDFRPYIGGHPGHRVFPAQMTLTESMAELFGLYLAEGFTFLGKGLGVRGGDNGKVSLSFGKHEASLVKQTIQLFDTVFGLKAWVDEGESAVKVVIGSNILSRFFRDQFGDTARNKKVPSMILFADQRIIRPFVLGYLKGDGCVDRSGVRFVTASEMVANQLVLLLAKLDIRATVGHHPPTESEIGGRLVHGSGWFEIRVGQSDSRRLGFEYQIPTMPQRTILRAPGVFLLPIRQIQKQHYGGQVFNLTTEAGSFVAPLVVTHNCHAFACGFDLRNEEAVNQTMGLFADVIGLDRLKVVHLNDSKGALGSRLDRHENLGKGKIGRKGIREFLRYPGVIERPLIMETPYKDFETMQRSVRLVRTLLR